MSEPKKIYTALATILKEIDPIKKDRKADMGFAGKYNFRGIDDLYNTLHSAFAENQVFILPEILVENSQIVEKEKNGGKTYSKHVTLQIRYRFIADDGSEVSSVGIGEAIDSSDKATNKAQSSALKYVLMQMFLIPTEEKKDVEDDNNQVAPPKKEMTSEWNATNTVWMTQEQFNSLLDLISRGENIEGVKATIKKYSGSVIEGVKYAMKREYKEKLITV